VGEDIQKKEVGKNASVKDLELCHRVERRIHAKKGKGVLMVERRKERSTSICGGSVEKRIHPTFQVTLNVTSTLCGKKEWHTKNSAGLSTYKPVDNKEWVSLTPYCRHIGWCRKEKGVYEAGPEVRIQ